MQRNNDMRSTKTKYAKKETSWRRKDEEGNKTAQQWRWMNKKCQYISKKSKLILWKFFRVWYVQSSQTTDQPSGCPRASINNMPAAVMLQMMIMMSQVMWLDVIKRISLYWSAAARATAGLTANIFVHWQNDCEIYDLHAPNHNFDANRRIWYVILSDDNEINLTWGIKSTSNLLIFINY